MHAFVKMVGVRSYGIGLSAPLWKRGECRVSFSMISEKYMTRSEDFTFYVELAGDMVSHADSMLA